MARITILVDKKKLEKAITEVEMYKTFNNRTELYNDVADHFNNKFPTNKHVTGAVIYLRVREFNLDNVIKTPKGKRGAKSGERLAIARANGQIVKRSRKDKIDKIDVNWEQMYNEFPDRFHSHIDRMKNGSLKSAVILKCIDCCNYQSAEVARCAVKTCPLYAFRVSALRDAAKQIKENENIN